jgi:hypothetical protein
MIGRSINLKLSGNNKPKEPKQKRKTRIRSSMPEGGEITFDVVFFLVCVLFFYYFLFYFTTRIDSFRGN